MRIYLDWRLQNDCRFIVKCYRGIFYILDWRLFVDNTGRWLTWYIFRSFSCYWRNNKWSNIYCPLWCNNWMDISSYKVSHYSYIEIAISWSWLHILWFNNRIDFLKHKLVTMVIYESLFSTFIFIVLIMSPLRRSGRGHIVFL